MGISFAAGIRITFDAASPLRLGFEESQKIGVDLFRLRRRHAVREVLVGLQRTILRKLRR
jgi:hypothetical protein